MWNFEVKLANYFWGFEPANHEMKEQNVLGTHFGDLNQPVCSILTWKEQSLLRIWIEMKRARLFMNSVKSWTEGRKRFWRFDPAKMCNLEMKRAKLFPSIWTRQALNELSESFLENHFWGFQPARVCNLEMKLENIFAALNWKERSKIF